MADVAQIVCPHCRRSLRIPTAWANQPMRCNFCQQIFQARAKVGAAPPVPTAAHAGNGVNYGTPGAPHAHRPGSHARSPLNALLAGSLVVAGVAVAAMAIVVVLGPSLLKMFNPGAAPQATKTAGTKSPDPSPNPATSPPPEIAKEKPKADPRPPQPEKKLPDSDKKPPAKDKKPAEIEKKPLDIDDGPPDQGKVQVISPDVIAIVGELALFPPTTGGKAAPINPASLPEFAPDVLDAYRANYDRSIMEYKDEEDKFPLRAAIAKTVQALRDNVKTTNMRKMVAGNLVDKQLLVLKNQVKNEQQNVAQRALVLKDLVKDLIAVGEKHRTRETKRCQVLFDYAQLRLKARLVYVMEYDFCLARIRTDNLPQLGPGDKLYRLMPQDKVSINEAYIKQYVKDLKNGWTKLAKNYPGTPWAFLAPREQEVHLGLAWEPAKK